MPIVQLLLSDGNLMLPADVLVGGPAEVNRIGNNGYHGKCLEDNTWWLLESSVVGI